MTQSTAPTPKAPAASRRGLMIALALGGAVLAAMALDTTVVHIGSDADVRQQAFAPDSFGDKEFPRVQAAVMEKAVDALVLGPAVLADKAAAAKQYGTASTTGAILSVKLTGVAGEVKSGVYTLAVEGLPLFDIFVCILGAWPERQAIDDIYTPVSVMIVVQCWWTVINFYTFSPSF